MKLIFALALVSLPNFAHADYLSARCQVALLRVTTEAFDREFAHSASQLEYIGQVTLNYGIKGEPRAVFFGLKKNQPEKRCLVQVYTKAIDADSESGCPEYKFTRIDSNCE